MNKSIFTITAIKKQLEKQPLNYTREELIAIRQALDEAGRLYEERQRQSYTPEQIKREIIETLKSLPFAIIGALLIYCIAASIFLIG